MHLFATQNFLPELGGMARFHTELCRRLARDDGGVAVSTVTTPGAASFDAAEPYHISRLPFTYAQAKHPVSRLRWMRQVTRACRSEQVRVLHCGDIRPCGYAVLWAHRRTGVPYVLYVHGGDVLRELQKIRAIGKRWSARRLFSDCAGVVAISAWTADVAADLMSRLAIARKPPIRVVELGADPVRFSPDRDRGRLRTRLALGDGPVLLTVARLVPHKGQDVAIRAVARLSQDWPALRYVLVGTGPDEPRLRQLVREVGVANHVVFAGRLNDDDTAEAYALASVYVGLSRVEGDLYVEGFGLSFLEAAASGTPSVAGDSGGVRSAVRSGETGIVVAADDPEKATQVLRQLLNDRSVLNAMGRAARRAVETHYNWDRVGQETIAFVHDAVREQEHRGGAVA